MYNNGGDIIEQIGVTKKRIFDPISIWQFFLNRNFKMGRIPYEIFKPYIINAERERNFTATRENARKSMDEAGVSFSVCLPVPPHLDFNDVKKAAEKDAGLIPFTGVDFSKMETLPNQFEEDVKKGAKGLKLHPVIQKVNFTDEKMKTAVDSFIKFDLPILFHAGVSNYYKNKEKSNNIPEYGSIKGARDLVAAFPQAKFIVGHAGMFDVMDVIRLLGKFKNVWVDTSLQPPGVIKKLIKTFGPEKVLFASDWPFGSRIAGIKAVKAACGSDKRLAEMLFYKNAENLLKI
ncbi:MAG: amidohydrolase family protein [Desulfobacterales bacterium]|nr:amidohydrolase family protein [Desulfobacterales bacterium]